VESPQCLLLDKAVFRIGQKRNKGPNSSGKEIWGVRSHLAWEKAADCRDQFRTEVRFLDEITAEEAGDECRLLLSVLTAYKDHSRFRCELAYLTSCFKAIHFGHQNSQHDHIGFDFLDSVKSNFAAFSFIDIPIGLVGQKRAQGMPQQPAVIYDQNFGCY